MASLPHNPISDPTPLVGTTTLGALGVAAAQLADIGPSAGHDTLGDLDLSGNAIADASGPAGAPLLQELQLGANPVTDVTPLLRLESLVTSGCTSPWPSTRGAHRDACRADRPLLPTLAVGSALGPA